MSKKKNSPQKDMSQGGNGSKPAETAVDLSAFLREISARLVTAGSISLDDPQVAIAEESEQLQIVIFVLDGLRYAVELKHVNEVVRHPQTTRVPGLPAWILGVSNLHGDIISVVDLPGFLEAGRLTTGQLATMLVAHAGDQRIGLMIDAIEVIYTCPIEAVISPPFKIEPGMVAYLRGAIEHEKEFIRLLDCERLILGPQMQQFS